MNILNTGFVSGAAGVIGPWLWFIIIWSFFWKGLALWHSGRRGHIWWFVAMVVINTAGILEIVYLFVILKLKFSELFKK